MSIQNLMPPSRGIKLSQGTAYTVASGTAVVFRRAGANWPDLTGASIALGVGTRRGTIFEAPGDVVRATGTSAAVRVELTAPQTALFGAGLYDYDVQATLASGYVVTLVRGKLHVEGVVSINPAKLPPLPPSELTVVATGETTTVLSWGGGGEASAGLRIERRAPGAPFVKIAEVDLQQEAYADSGLRAGVRYEYRLSAFNRYGASYSETVAATTHAPGFDLYAPLRLVLAGPPVAGIVFHDGKGGYLFEDETTGAAATTLQASA